MSFRASYRRQGDRLCVGGRLLWKAREGIRTWATLRGYRNRSDLFTSRRLFILTLATRSAGQKVNAAGQNPPQINEKKYAISLLSGLLFNLPNARDSEHSLLKTTIVYRLTSAFLLNFSLRDWQLLLCSLKRGWEYFLKSLTHNNLCTKV